MLIIELLSQPFWYRLGLTLTHFLWQGLVVAILAGVVVRLFKLSPGNTRYAAYLLAFIVVAICPVITFTAIDASVEPVTRAPATEAEAHAPFGAIPHPILPVDNTSLETEALVTKVRTPGTMQDSISLRQKIYDYLEASLPWAIAGWMIGVVALSMRLLLGFIGVYRWRRHLEPLPEDLCQRVASLSERLGMRNFSPVFISPSALQAMAVGYLRPLILLPAAMVTQMQPEMLEAVIAHELAHIRRFDLWINLAQRVMETLLFFHPAVWWLSNRLRSERELCCDELAVRATGERLTYASALETAGRARLLAKQFTLAVGIGQDKRSTLSRVRHILGIAPKPQNSRFWLAGVVTILFLTALLVPTASVLSVRAGTVITAETEQTANKLGQLEYIDHLSTEEYLSRCTSVAISPDGRHLYATAYGSRCLVIFGRDQVTGYITHLKTIPLKGAFTTRVSPDGRYVVCSDVGGRSEHFAGSNSVSLFERDQLTGNLTILDSVKNGENAIENLNYVVDAGFSPDSRFLYVVARRSDAVTAFRITDEKKLAFVQCNKGRNQCFDGARGIAVSPDGKYLYVTSTQAGTLAVLQRNAETGKIDLKQVIRDEQGDIHGLGGVWDVTCSLDGKFIYTNAGGRQGKDSAICTFKRTSDNTLSLIQEIRGDAGRIGLVGGTRLRVSPGGRHLYALGMNSDSIVAFQRHRKTGKLTHTQTHSCKRIGRLCFPADLVISPDGAYVYVGGEGIGLNGIIFLKRLTGMKMGPAEALYKVACFGDKGQVQSLIERGADINEKGARGYTALHWAAKENQRKVAELLLEAGADVNVRTGENGWTPLHVAAAQSNKEVAESLIAKGADLDAENRNNRQTPIMITQRISDMDFAEFLFNKGASLDARDEWGWTPLHHSASQGDTIFADLLIKQGANINEKTKEGGQTPLFFAIRLHDVKTIQWFISKGADINTKDQRDRTLLDWAKRMNYTDIVELLRKHGAKE